MKKFVTSLLFVTLFCAASQPAWSWGRDGHHLIALVALNHISSATKTQVQELLGSETLVSVSTWPDEIRHDRDETAGWHYVDIPKSAAFFDEQRDCYQPYSGHKGAETDHHDCVVDRVEMFARQLADTSQPKEARIEALKFLVHFVGDIHQPLHAMDEAQGGNQIKIVQFGSATCSDNNRPCNLHALWDGGMIDHTKLDETAYAQKLEELIQADRLDLRTGGTAADWANESHRYAEGLLLPQGGVVDEFYFREEIPVVNERLALAGLRLAHMLDEAFQMHP